MNIVEEVEIECPQCGERFNIDVETIQSKHDFICDCTVCCRPIAVRILCEPGKVVEINITVA